MITEVILIVVRTLGHNVLTYVTLVVLIFVCTFTYKIAANVAFVIARICVNAKACYDLAAPVALVVAVNVDTM